MKVVCSWNVCNNEKKEIIIHKENCSSIEQVKPKEEQKSKCHHYEEFTTYEEAIKWCKNNKPHFNARKCKKCFNEGEDNE